MEDNTLYKIEEPDKIVLAFLNYLEKETPIRFDIPAIYGKFAWATSDVPELNTSISIPAIFYYVNVTNFPLQIVLRYCPCELCNKVVYVELLIGDKNHEINTANIVKNHIKKAVPDMIVYITKKSKPLFIKNNLVDFN